MRIGARAEAYNQSVGNYYATLEIPQVSRHAWGDWMVRIQWRRARTVDNTIALARVASLAPPELRIRRNSRQPVSWTPWNSIITRQLAMIKIFRHLACTRHINIFHVDISGDRPAGDRPRLYGNVKAIERERESKNPPSDRSRTRRKFVFFL